ncbi:uncharacterized protein [Populus alba]|uniref:uncharacterized protein isoform X1 n=1 Tax=Populus alba TaxID=43335 RepID=UPI003CC7029B
MATTESLVAQIQGLSSNAVDLGLLSIHLKKADEVLHNESTRLLAFLEQLDPTLHSLGNLVFPFWRMIFLMLISHGNFFSIVIMGDTQDYNEDGKLSFSEFSDLIKAFGNQVADNKKEELFKAADKNGDDAVSMDELAGLPAFQQENEPLINCCPVCGEILEVSNKLNTLVHLSLCFDERTRNQVMTGGFLTDKQASYGWMFKLSEWAHFSSYDVGLNSGSSASHILVKETLLVAREGRVWCLEDRLVLGGFDWDPTLQEKACWSRRPFDRVCMPLDKWRGDSDSDFEVFELFDPAATGKVVGRISLSCSVEDPMETEKNYARCILAIVDYNEDGKLSFSEFSDLIKAFGNQVADNKKEELFKAADKNGDDAVSMDELAGLPAFQQENEPLINCCPVCGEILEVSNKLNTLVHLSLCFDERTRNQVMTGGFLTDKQASYGWMFKLSEWAHFSSYDVGLNSGSSASHSVLNQPP